MSNIGNRTSCEVPERLLNCIETGTTLLTKVIKHYTLASNLGLKNLKNLNLTIYIYIFGIFQADYNTSFAFCFFLLPCFDELLLFTHGE